jgi:sulfite reductase (ferredoxin)
VTGVSDVDTVVDRLSELGLPLSTNEIWANSIACTGEPHCNFSVGETKDRLRVLVDHLEATFGDDAAELRLHLDGCPHACAQHWVGDLGFQATTGKDAEGNRMSAYDIFVRGSLGPAPEVGRSLFRRVASEQLEHAVEGLVRGWIAQREPDESFTDFQRRLSDDDLGALAGLEPARKRSREEVEA